MSILWRDPTVARDPVAPSVLRDLNLDVVADAVAALAPESDLRVLLHTPLVHEEEVRFRQDVMRDVMRAEVRSALAAFTAAMSEVKRDLELSKKLENRHERNDRVLHAAARYVAAVMALNDALDRAGLASNGMRGFAEWLHAYRTSETFVTLAATADRVSRELASVRYALVLQPGRITVRADVAPTDHTANIERTFEKFRRDGGKDYRIVFRNRTGLNHVEIAVLDRLARLVPEPFEALACFVREHDGFVDERIATFARELQFYLAWLAYIDRLGRAGLRFCLPALSRTELHAEGAFDLALAETLVHERRPVVTNDFSLGDRERVFLVSGPNQAGKTTFGRTFGQLHFLASLGCHVPAASATLPVADRVLTHFEQQEDIADERGRLKDELVRAKALLERATARSIFVMNEVFSSTALVDAIALSRVLLAQLTRRGARGVWVTFVPDLESSNEGVVSLVAGVSDADPSHRTFKLERRPPTGVAYALSLAEKYGVTYERLRERLA